MSAVIGTQLNLATMRYKMTNDKSYPKSNYLPSSGFTKTDKIHHQWAGDVVKEARSLFGGDGLPVKAHVWAYRESGYDHLSCDLFSGDKVFPVTICIAGEACFPIILGGAAEADAYDMPDALHIAGIISTALAAEVVLGRNRNEVNEDLLAEPLMPGETNGVIELWESAQHD